MIKLISILIIFIALVSCSPTEPISIDSIQIIKKNPHPFLRDHDRFLITVDNEGKEIDQEKLYPDTGRGTNSYLFENGDEFILIDENGYWYRIDLQSGDITKDKWSWEKELPSEYLGTYTNSNGKYLLTKEEQISPKMIYKHKDPD